MDNNDKIKRNIRRAIVGPALGPLGFLLVDAMDKKSDRDREEGYRDGYVYASNEYEEKLIKQGDLLLEEKKLSEKNKREYNELMDKYEETIEELQEKLNRTERENAYLNRLIENRNKLLNIK